jgi:putative copper resistance protein D
MTTAVFAFARTLHIGSAMLLVALPFFLLITLKSTDDTVSAYGSFFSKVVRWLWIALAAEAVSGIAWFWFVTAQMSDQSPWRQMALADLGAVLCQTQFGQLWVGRSVVGIALGATLCLVSRKSLAPPRFSSPSYLLILLFSSGLLATLAWAGHAASGIHFYVLHLVADVLHLLVGAIWPIGLIPMGGFLWNLSQRNQKISQLEIDTLHRFSKASLFAVVVLVATGIINACLMIGSSNALLTTPYGQLLLSKVAIVALMIGLGGLNRFYLLPQIKLEQASIRSLRKTILAESVLAVAALLIVGAMGMTAPPS